MNTIALILAAGGGKRFSPIVTSKPLFPFFSKPIIDYIAKALQQAGFSKIVVVANEKNEIKIKEALSRRLSVQTVIQKTPSGMADAILSSEKFIKNRSIFVMNAHDIVEQSLFNLAKQHIGKHQAFIIAKRQREYIDLGYLSFSGANKKLTGIVEKPGEGHEPSDLVNLVFHYFSNADEFIKILTKTTSKKDDVYEKALTHLIQTDKVDVLTYKGYWQPLKFPWQVLDMTKLFLEKRLKVENLASEISKSAHVDSNVFLGEGVKVLENAVIKGPSWIGENTIIGTNTLILESMIGKKSVIGFSSEVSRSYVGDGCWLHTNYIGDSVLEGENYLGAGAVTANFRFDAGQIYSDVKQERVNTKKSKFGVIIARQARVGVNASLMPGVKMGQQAIVGPGVVQYQDVKAKEKIIVNK